MLSLFGVMGVWKEFIPIMSISQIRETKTAAFLHSIHISFAVTFCERGSNIDSSCRGDPGKENEKHLIIRNVMFGILEKCQPLVSILRIR